MMEEAELAKMKLAEETRIKEEAMVEALKQSTAEKEAALHAQMASAMEEEKRKLDEQRKQSHDVCLIFILRYLHCSTFLKT